LAKIVFWLSMMVLEAIVDDGWLSRTGRGEREEGEAALGAKAMWETRTEEG